MSWFARWSLFSSASAETLWPFLWQSSLLILAVGLILLPLPQLAPRWRHRVWLVVAAKLLILPCWYWMLPWQTPTPRQPLTATKQTLTPQKTITPQPLPPPPNATSENTPDLSRLFAQLHAEAAVTNSGLTSLHDTSFSGAASAAALPVTPARPLVIRIPAMFESPPPRTTPNRLRAAKLSPGKSPHTLAPALPTWHLPRWEVLLFSLWILGIIAGVARWLIHWTRLRSLLKHSNPAPAELQQASERLAAAFYLKRPPRLVVTQPPGSPFVCGGLSPTIVIPDSLLPQLTPQETQNLLLHELAHLARRDLWWNWLPELCVVLYWFHPLVYWVRSQTRFETEMACDQLAMQIGDVRPGDYADTLLRIVTHLTQPRHNPHLHILQSGLPQATRG